ncbi:uncharacterized protein LOC114337664 isoform X1 [Diabrotica virgifera virgifera]|uniref:Uncharacterized protein n=2 Tax=Diabrotica virgifera virgifera TaxID=50390 RepID=A0ABM5K808_DIAVI|nr:uncharacterized protein LOC114337664 isoform X1 [Diabrotica virgifera virgifera]XP_050506322.1 uncharacterized protein LOC114337664 isoform X1 [Diabrotica virgifera virgifera]
MQILNLTKDEEKQFSNFMGRTQNTHEECYELSVDIYQTAKVSKLLLLMEKGSVPLSYKVKSLTEIDIDLDYPEEDDDKNEEDISLNVEEQAMLVPINVGNEDANTSGNLQAIDPDELNQPSTSKCTKRGFLNTEV